MSTDTESTTEPSKAAWKRYESKQRKLEDIHDCDNGTQVHRVESPGFDIAALSAGTFVGPFVSQWTCPTCEPIVAAMVDELFSGHQVAERKSS